MLGLLAACGGTSSGPQSESNSYGHSVAEMQSASASASASVGTVTLQAWGNESSQFEPGIPKWTVDPISGRVEFQPGTATSYPTWFIAVALTNAAGDKVATDWTVTTVWVLQGGEFISSRGLYTQDGKLFVVGYPNPPLSLDGTKAVVELTRSGLTQLVSATIMWPT